jgi:hypothetical protein
MSQAGIESNRPGSRDGLVPAVAATISAVATAAAVVLTTLIVALILRAADHISAKAAKAGTDGGTSQATAALVSNDAARSGTAEGAEYRTGLGVGAAATGNEADRESGQQGAKGCFHKMVQGFKVGWFRERAARQECNGHARLDDKMLSAFNHKVHYILCGQASGWTVSNVRERPNQ